MFMRLFVFLLQNGTFKKLLFIGKKWAISSVFLYVYTIF